VTDTTKEFDDLAELRLAIDLARLDVEFDPVWGEEMAVDLYLAHQHLQQHNVRQANRERLGRSRRNGRLFSVHPEPVG
jgi:hypothetical protein